MGYDVNWLMAEIENIRKIAAGFLYKEEAPTLSTAPIGKIIVVDSGSGDQQLFLRTGKERLMEVTTEATLASLTDVTMSGTVAHGDILFRDAAHWVNLPKGTDGQFLQTQGADANPKWGTPSKSSYATNTDTGSGSSSGGWSDTTASVTVTATEASNQFVITFQGSIRVAAAFEAQATGAVGIDVDDTVEKEVVCGEVADGDEANGASHPFHLTYIVVFGDTSSHTITGVVKVEDGTGNVYADDVTLYATEYTL